MKKLAAFLLGLLLSAMAMGANADMPGPDVLIKNTVKEVLDIVQHDADIQAGNQQKILELVDAKVLPHFDFYRMTRLAVGRGWRKATPEQRNELVHQFRTLLVRTYTSAFTRYRDQSVEVQPFQMPAGADEATVKTLIIKPGAQSIAVNYEMEKTDDGWKAFDLSVEGASLVTTYRGTFTEQIQQSGIDGLIKMLTDKNQSLAKTASNKAAAK